MDFHKLKFFFCLFLMKSANCLLSLKMLIANCSNAESLEVYSVLVDQMLVHFYSEKMLFFRYCVREALNSIKGIYTTHFEGNHD